MKYTVDRIINNIAVLENRDTLEITEVPLSKLPSSIHEGAIIVFDNDKYTIDNLEEDNIRKELEDRFKRLRRN